MQKSPVMVLCIAIACLIVLASFTSVVGFQSIKSNSAKISPLFRIRTKRAINTESKDTLTSDHVGEGFRLMTKV